MTTRSRWGEWLRGKLRTLNINLHWSGRLKTMREELDLIRSRVWAYYNLVSVGQDLIYLIPTNKTFYLETLIIDNNEVTTPSQYTFYDSAALTVPVLPTRVGTQDTLIGTDLKGFFFTTGVYVIPSQFAAGARIAVGGVLDHQD